MVIGFIRNRRFRRGYGVRFGLAVDWIGPATASEFRLRLLGGQLRLPSSSYGFESSARFPALRSGARLNLAGQNGDAAALATASALDAVAL